MFNKVATVECFICNTKLETTYYADVKEKWQLLNTVFVTRSWQHQITSIFKKWQQQSTIFAGVSQVLNNVGGDRVKYTLVFGGKHIYFTKLAKTKYDDVKRKWRLQSTIFVGVSQVLDNLGDDRVKCRSVFAVNICNSGPGCSKLTTSLVNVSLNFQKLISQICQYFC